MYYLLLVLLFAAQTSFADEEKKPLSSFEGVVKDSYVLGPGFYIPIGLMEINPSKIDEEYKFSSRFTVNKNIVCISSDFKTHVELSNFEIEHYREEVSRNNFANRFFVRLDGALGMRCVFYLVKDEVKKEDFVFPIKIFQKMKKTVVNEYKDTLQSEVLNIMNTGPKHLAEIETDQGPVTVELSVLKSRNLEMLYGRYIIRHKGVKIGVLEGYYDGLYERDGVSYYGQQMYPLEFTTSGDFNNDGKIDFVLMPLRDNGGGNYLFLISTEKDIYKIIEGRTTGC